MLRILIMASISANLPILLAFPFTKQFGDLCDWRDQPEVCDQSRGLACSYTTSSCECWDLRKLYSLKVHRCVGKSGEECAYHESERLCTENAYCLEDRSLSIIPLCVCLKGYFRSDNGTCVKYSKIGESCQPFPSRQACEPETGLKCIGFSCQCESDQFFDPVKEICIAKAGQKCSRTMNNCIENSECNEKMWAFDHESGETKITGYRCACKSGLKITEDGSCAADYGGSCNKTSECFLGENLTCLNGVCQCHPLSQIYDKKSRRCYNLVGTRCHLPDEGGKNSSLKNRTKIAVAKTGSDESPCGTEGADCIANAECVSTAQGNLCRCINGSSETVMKTCLLDYGQSCQPQKSNQLQSQSRTHSLTLQKHEKQEKEMKCNVFEGLICHSDLGKCLCADPSLVYDEDAKSCVATVGSPCGNVRLDMLDLDEDFKQMIFINCDTNNTCLEKNINGKVKRVCVPKGVSTAGGGSSLSKIMFNNANVITDAE